MTFSITVGKYGGFYIYWGFTKRIALGWIAFDLFPFELDDYLHKKLVSKEEEEKN